nr:MinD/ParA family protein [Methanococcus aeolicus]
MILKIGFYSIQGGTGKTTIATNMAYHLSKIVRTIYVDCDLYGTTAPMLFGFENNVNTLNAYLNGDIPLEDMIQQYDTLSLILCDATPEAFNTNSNPEKVVELINLMEKEFDVVIYDLPPNITEGNLLFVGSERLNNIIMVSNDSIPGIANTLKTADLLDELDIGIIGTVVNMDMGNVQFEEVVDKLLAILPYDKKVEKQYIDNVPIIDIKNSKFRKELIKLSDELAGAYIEEGIATERALNIAKDLRGAIIGEEPLEDKSDEDIDFDMDDFDIEEFNPKRL